MERQVSARGVRLEALETVDDLEIVSAFALGDLVAVFPRQRSTGTLGLWLVPAGRLEDVVAPRSQLTEAGALHHSGAARAWAIDPLVHVACSGDVSGDQLLPGRSTRDASSTNVLALVDQECIEELPGIEIVTRLAGAGLGVTHRLSWREGQRALASRTEVTNRSSASVTLESLTSVSIGGITPFSADASPRLAVHRTRSHWGAEARIVTESLERLHLDRTWIPVWYGVERFGQVGSTPLSGFGSLVAVEDRIARVTWALHLRWGGSWQVELARRDDDLCLSTGLADVELGHWRKSLAPGDSFDAPEALVTVVSGDLDDACARLVQAQEAGLSARLDEETELPVQFNEYATTWGNPSAARALAIAQRLASSGVRYLVVDCGWFTAPGGAWGRTHGDWKPDPTRFPEGLASFCRSVRDLGLIPGIWLEPETCGDESEAFADEGRLLARHGVPLTVGNRRFLDLQEPKTARRLGETVAGLLRDGGFGYVKLDYNASIGVGCDGAESLGEGLRRQVEGTGLFLETLRACSPEVVVELCASGGHRNEPWLLSRVDVASSSDAFEVPEIPIIAANMQRMMPPRQSLVWCTLREQDTASDIVYKLASTFLGRMCLSGDVTELSAQQWSIVEDGLALYRRCAATIRDGSSRRFGDEPESYRYPRGWQGVARVREGGSQALVVVHGFDGEPPRELEIALGGNRAWRVSGSLCSPGVLATGAAGGVRFTGLSPWSAAVALLEPLA